MRLLLLLSAILSSLFGATSAVRASMPVHACATAQVQEVRPAQSCIAANRPVATAPSLRDLATAPYRVLVVGAREAIFASRRRE